AVVIVVDAAGEALGLELDLAGDAGQQLGGCRGDGRGRQAVDAGDVEVPAGDVETAAGDAAFGAGFDRGRGGSVAVETDDEPAVRRGGGQGLAVDEDEGPGPGAADGVAALDEAAGQVEIGGLAARGAGGGEGRGSGEEGAAIRGHRAGASRCRASAGPA